MYLGKPLFVQVMDFLPWKTFHRIVDRYGGDHRTRSLSCAEQFRVMAFALLTYRESLRDIEVCLAAQAGKLYHMGIGAAKASSTAAGRCGRSPPPRQRIGETEKEKPVGAAPVGPSHALLAPSSRARTWVTKQVNAGNFC